MRTLKVNGTKASPDTWQLKNQQLQVIIIILQEIEMIA
jgi:hypothetical protein